MDNEERIIRALENIAGQLERIANVMGSEWNPMMVQVSGKVKTHD